MTTMPKPAQKRTTSSGIGAEALAVQTSRSKPARARIGSRTSALARRYAASSPAGGSSPRSRYETCSRAVPPAASITARRSAGSPARAARTLAASFSHTLGTPKN